MLFQKKLDRSLEHLKEEGKQHGETLREARDQNESLKLEKLDIPAMILSALLVFGPIVLILLLIAFLCL